MTATSGSQNLGLIEKQEKYKYNYSHIPPVAMVDTLPESEKWSIPWKLMVAKVGYQLLVNKIIVTYGDQGKAGAANDVRAFLIARLKETFGEQKGLSKVRVLLQGARFLPRIIWGEITTDVVDVEEVMRDAIKTVSRDFLEDFAANVMEQLTVDGKDGRCLSSTDFERLFATIDLPEIAYEYQTDESFAYMRVAGPNAVMLEKITEPDPRFPVTEAHYQAVMGEGDSLAAARAEGRLFLCDYEILDGAVNGSFPTDQKYLYAPLALFAVPKADAGKRDLRPVAIQLGQKPKEYPILTPKSNRYAWLCAKTAVQVADANFHEAVTHLGRTHLFMGPFVIATHRQLPENHPLFKLLTPHFLGMLAINDSAQAKLIYKGGGVDKILATTIDNARLFAVLGVQTYGFNRAMLPDQLAARGVDDTEALPVYPYRDDALLIWEAIYNWVKAYLKTYYPGDSAVQRDQALQAWAKELISYKGGRVVDFGEDGDIKTLSYLIDAVTLIIFTVSAQHAAVNFPQKGLMSFAPGMPTAGYAPLDNLGDQTAEQDYLDLLPPISQAQEQLKLCHLLGSVHFTQLGQYDKKHLGDPKIQKPLRQFQGRLEEIEMIIHKRNGDRPTYEYLLPSLIPQSINI
ncbi:lipoxygenase family protein [[Limnothrix rosea] IAM M-220]|uniref:lipoxygenase family protein n=1 Tax=[Limnothrix rosea] IAM M-220 TaxID=454133 RepID=UPI00095AE9E7|nr:lipoxygenase family protein [[Limnothrix rosea] IAM M-220]OKH19070.1 lipoxygenase [[Limnothrix rosea] IAM M-220]